VKVLLRPQRKHTGSPLQRSIG